MKKNYVSPELEVVRLTLKDVILSSPSSSSDEGGGIGGNNGGWENDDLEDTGGF